MVDMMHTVLEVSQKHGFSGFSGFKFFCLFQWSPFYDVVILTSIQEFKVDAMEKFIEKASTPLVTLFVIKGQNMHHLNANTLFVIKGKYFGIEEDQAPVLIVQDMEGLIYVNSHVQVSEIAPWLNDYTQGKLKSFIKSESIPETNNEPVKVVIAKSLRDMVLDSKKNGKFSSEVGSQMAVNAETNS